MGARPARSAWCRQTAPGPCLGVTSTARSKVLSVLSEVTPFLLHPGSSGTGLFPNQDVTGLKGMGAAGRASPAARRKPFLPASSTAGSAGGHCCAGAAGPCRTLLLG